MLLRSVIKSLSNCNSGLQILSFVTKKIIIAVFCISHETFSNGHKWLQVSISKHWPLVNNKPCTYIVLSQSQLLFLSVVMSGGFCWLRQCIRCYRTSDFMVLLRCNCTKSSHMCKSIFQFMQN